MCAAATRGGATLISAGNESRFDVAGALIEVVRHDAVAQIAGKQFVVAIQVGQLIRAVQDSGVSFTPSQRD